jgi:hypothetical protein
MCPDPEHHNDGTCGCDRITREEVWMAVMAVLMALFAIGTCIASGLVIVR